MKRFALIALALVACKKDKAQDAKAEPKADKDAPLTCPEVAKNPAIAADPDTAKEFLAYCKDHPDEFSQELLRCLNAAKSEADLNLCEDGAPPEEAEPTRPEAEANLDYLKKSAKAYFAEFAAFPVGDMPRSPASPCCDSGTPDRKCAADPAVWTSGDPAAPSVWDTLDFSVDEPHFYQYAYKGTAEAFTAMAVGDLDCDANAVTYVLEGSVVQGNTIFKLTKPARAD